MEINGVIFDFNGTLFLDSELHFQAWEMMFQKYKGITLNEEERKKYLIGGYNEEILKIIFEDTLTDEELVTYSKEKEAIYRELCLAQPDGCHLVDGAEQLFNRLLELQIPFTIASASIKDNMDFFIEQFHLDHWIKKENILYDDGTFNKKSQMYIAATNLLNIPMSKTLIFDDSESGIKGCKEAGCDQVIVICDNNNKKDMMKKDGVIDTAQNYHEILKKYF